MQAYLDEPEMTAATIHDGWLHTGDLGFLDESGNLTLSGRASEVIITGGFNVYPAEIENVLARVPGVREAPMTPTGGNASRRLSSPTRAAKRQRAIFWPS
jgi:acyl-CoA synthetase (AMP-forming)/AMP-acid ligase II